MVRAVLVMLLAVPLSAAGDAEEKADCWNVIGEGKPCVEYTWIEMDDGEWVVRKGSENCRVYRTTSRPEDPRSDAEKKADNARMEADPGYIAVWASRLPKRVETTHNLGKEDCECSRQRYEAWSFEKRMKYHYCKARYK